MSDKEANVQVVIRLRPRSKREIGENSSICVTAPGLKSKELHIRTAMTESFHTTKSYTFDNVFGPDSDQEMVFESVAAPIIDEVLEGYNCTIFAYGQTGTGKTYTMEGELDDTASVHAGIIPRSLNRLFQVLDASKVDYSVKVSFIELYNEELIDLLSGNDDRHKLRIYEDNARKGCTGVVIQPLEEFIVKNTADVISILQRGSKKRQIAATDFNEASSRSHCVFLITVHTREEVNGEDLLKVGKLYLVDLAGSENISRSGAENKRAREAGIINQSLLTLGRVINSLVDKSPHVPYRESKLTRLLQDSLGGKTKTCIIATVSPARSCLEETLSTLDYANRAKKIRNKPEVNQRMTKKALIKEYSAEIDRLKSDLQAAREKNGVYLTQERYEELLKASTGTRERLQELSQELQSKSELASMLEKRLAQSREETVSAEKSLQDTLTQRDKLLLERDAALAKLQKQQQLKEVLISDRQNLEDIARELRDCVSRLHSDARDFSSRLLAQNISLQSDREALSSFKLSSVLELAKLREALAKFQSHSLVLDEELSNKAETWQSEMQQLIGTLRESLATLLSRHSVSVREYLSQMETMDAVNKTASVRSELRAKVESQISCLEKSVTKFVLDSLEEIERVGNHLQGEVLESASTLSEEKSKLMATLADGCSSVVELFEKVGEALSHARENAARTLKDTSSAVELCKMKREQALAASQQRIAEKLKGLLDTAFEEQRELLKREVCESDAAQAQGNETLMRAFTEATDKILASKASFLGSVDCSAQAANSFKAIEKSVAQSLQRVSSGVENFKSKVENFRSSQAVESVKGRVLKELDAADGVSNDILDLALCSHRKNLDDLNSEVDSRSENLQESVLQAHKLANSGVGDMRSLCQLFIKDSAIDLLSAGGHIAEDLGNKIKNVQLATSEATFAEGEVVYNIPQEWKSPESEEKILHDIEHGLHNGRETVKRAQLDVCLPTMVKCKRDEPSSSPYFHRAEPKSETLLADPELQSPLKKRTKVIGADGNLSSSLDTLAQQALGKLYIDQNKQSFEDEEPPLWSKGKLLQSQSIASLDTLVDTVAKSEGSFAGSCNQENFAPTESQLPRLTRSRTRIQGDLP